MKTLLISSIIALSATAASALPHDTKDGWCNWAYNQTWERLSGTQKMTYVLVCKTRGWN